MTSRRYRHAPCQRDFLTSYTSATRHEWLNLFSSRHECFTSDSGLTRTRLVSCVFLTSLMYLFDPWTAGHNSGRKKTLKGKNAEGWYLDWKWKTASHGLNRFEYPSWESLLLIKTETIGFFMQPRFLALTVQEEQDWGLIRLQTVYPQCTNRRG